MKNLLEKISELKSTTNTELKQVRFGDGNFYVEWKGVKIFASEPFLRELQKYLEENEK